jgi:beta-glucosidase
MVVLINGHTLNITWLDEYVTVLLDVRLPGEQGTEAVADIIFGDVNFGGKLAITFPCNVG